MRCLMVRAYFCALMSACVVPAFAGDCPGNPDALGVARVLELDTTAGPLLGTLQYEHSLELAPKEVVLTFDDGPNDRTTLRVLAALKRECAKAIFFPVGIMARHYPEVLQAVAEQGHTIGAHTWSHPNNLGRLAVARAQQQIEKGFEAVDEALDKEIAPFFRFPGLNDSGALRSFAAKRGYAVFSTDISSDDWLAIGSATIVRRTMARLRRQGRGIILFHDTKSTTAAALPQLLRIMKDEGYKLVHVVPSHSYRTKDKPEVATVQPPEKARTVAKKSDTSPN